MRKSRQAMMRVVADRSGVVALEFTVVGLLLFTFIFGIVEAGRAFWTRSSLQFAVEEAARWAMVNPSATGGQITEKVGERFRGLNPANLTVTVSEPDAACGCRLVIATIPFRAVVPLIPLGNPTLRGQAAYPSA